MTLPWTFSLLAATVLVPSRSGTNSVAAKSENVQGNVITLNGVSEHNRDYDLPAGEGDAGNWFDGDILQFPDGFYSIKDKLGDLMANPKTAAIVGKFLAEGMSGGAMAAFNGSEQDEAPDMFSGPMGDFMRLMRLDNMLKMNGGAVSADARRDLNEQLTKIKK